MSVAKRFIILGSALIGLAALLAVPGVALVYAAVPAGTPPGQGVLILVDSLIRMTNILLPAAGSAFLACGLTLHYLALAPARADRNHPHQQGAGGRATESW